ncbi:MAG: phospholipase D family protein, partial [Desulfobacterales bacterium]|nr:phospholipase D family protein [Desulfobacterales bacterium]
MKKDIVLLFFLTLLLSSCAATLPTDFPRTQSQSYTDTDTTFLGQTVHPLAANHPGKSGFHILDDGLDAFVARVVLARSAQRSLDIQYYLYHDDLIGRLFTEELFKAADRGVRVRLLVDDMDLKGRDIGATAIDSHPNIEVRIFNPFSRDVGRITQLITRLGSVTRRMHNKSFTADNQVSILGGRNIGNTYFNADPDLAFADLDVMCIGPVVEDVSDSFDLYWNSELSYPASVLAKETVTKEQYSQGRKELATFVALQSHSLYMKSLTQSNLAEKLRNNKVDYAWGDAQIVYDLPEKITAPTDHTEYHLVPQLTPYLEGVEKELIILSPYFVPGKAGSAFLIDLVKKGIKVKILTNSLASTDVSIVHAGYARYRERLLKGGVELYEVNKKADSSKKTTFKGSSKASLHAKSFIFDRKYIFIGSLNLDPRSFIQNTEIGVLFSSKDIGEQLGIEFKR